MNFLGGLFCGSVIRVLAKFSDFLSVRSGCDVNSCKSHGVVLMEEGLEGGNGTRESCRVASAPRFMFSTAEPGFLEHPGLSV